jgi:hypothetical protein
MAALVLTIASALGLGLSPSRAADDDPPAEVPVVENKVKLDLRISGLGAEGGTIEIKPGHKGCKFKPVVLTLARPKGVDPDAPLQPRDGIVVLASTISADRDCSFAITIKEPGQKPKTYRRGLRLDPAEAGKPLPEQTLKVYLSTPSIASRVDSPPKG